MFSMFVNSVKLFLQGKLFRDQGAALRAWAIGFIATIALILGLSVGTNLWVGAIAGGLLGGALMPYLFRNLKYN
jgi:hypothetical protein